MISQSVWGVLGADISGGFSEGFKTMDPRTSISIQGLGFVLRPEAKFGVRRLTRFLQRLALRALLCFAFRGFAVLVQIRLGFCNTGV